MADPNPATFRWGPLPFRLEAGGRVCGDADTFAVWPEAERNLRLIHGDD
jgi:hypothetical protein